MRRQNVQTLRAIVEVRDVQRAAAELAVGRSEQRLREHKRRRDEASGRLERDQTAWENCLSQHDADLSMAVAWSRQVLISEGEWRLAQEGAERAAREKDERIEAWRLAQARADTASTTAQKFAVRIHRLAEEAALAELADRTTLQRTAR